MSWQPGWYDDPWTPGGQRWWDGSGWTQHTSAASQTAAGGRKRRVWPWVAGAAALLLLMAGGAVALVLAISADDDEATRPAIRPPRTERTTPEYKEPASNRLPPRPVGESVTLRNQDGERVRVTVTGVKDPVPRGSYFRDPKRGTRWVGVQMRFEALGPGTYDDSASNGLRVVTEGGRYEADFAELDACPPIGDLRLAPGRTEQGCIVVPVPRGEDPESVRFTPSSGYAPDVGTWRLP